MKLLYSRKHQNNFSNVHSKCLQGFTGKYFNLYGESKRAWGNFHRELENPQQNYYNFPGCNWFTGNPCKCYFCSVVEWIFKIHSAKQTLVVNNKCYVAWSRQLARWQRFIRNVHQTLESFEWTHNGAHWTEKFKEAPNFFMVNQQIKSIWSIRPTRVLLIYD